MLVTASPLATANRLLRDRGSWWEQLDSATTPQACGAGCAAEELSILQQQRHNTCSCHMPFNMGLASSGVSFDEQSVLDLPRAGVEDFAAPGRLNIENDSLEHEETLLAAAACGDERRRGEFCGVAARA